MPRTLEEAGFSHVGHVWISDQRTFTIEYDLMPEAEWWVCSLYAFRIMGEVVRIGKTLFLRQRIAAWQRDVTNALKGKFRRGATTQVEANEWTSRLVCNLRGDFFAMRILPPNIKVLRSKETQLVEEYDPPLNHERRRRA
jgi:hypothetical protein